MSEDREIVLHGRRVSYRTSGPDDGPAVVLIHGIANSAASFVDTPDLLTAAAGVRVIAPDLYQSGDTKDVDPDISLGGRAALVRDMMIALHVPHATFVGHSLGGGVSLQFAYLFPRRVERLVLVASGGFGRSVSPLLRYATLPGAEAALSLLASAPARRAAGMANRAVDAATAMATGHFQPSDLEATRSFSSLADAAVRTSFVSTARHVIDLGGQRISALDRLYLAGYAPVMFVHGDRDRIIPANHSRRGHARVPHSRLEIIEGAGHFPHLDRPQLFARLVHDFIETTEAARLDDDLLARIMEEEESASLAASGEPDMDETADQESDSAEPGV